MKKYFVLYLLLLWCQVFFSVCTAASLHKGNENPGRSGDQGDPAIKHGISAFQTAAFNKIPDNSTPLFQLVRIGGR